MKDSHPVIVSVEVFDKVQEEMVKRSKFVRREDGSVEASVNIMVNTFWEICLCAVHVEHFIGEGLNPIRWSGATLQG